MGITLKTFPGGTITDTDDAVLHDYLSGGKSGVLGELNAAISGTDCRIESARLLIAGRIVEVAAYSVPLALASSETMQGRIYAEINLWDAENPITVKTVAAASLPALVQGDINHGDELYQYELATYSATATTASDLVVTARPLKLSALAVSESAPNNPNINDLWAW